MKIGNIVAIGATTGIGGGGGGTDTFLTSSYAIRMSGSMSSREYRIDYLQTSGSFSGSLWNRTLESNESLRIDGTVVGYSIGPEEGAGGIPGNRYFKQTHQLDVMDNLGSPYIISQVAGAPLRIRTQFKSNLRILGSVISLEVTNSVGGIVDWSSDFEFSVSKTTPTSYASPIFDPNDISGLWGWWTAGAGLYKDAAGTLPVTLANDPVWVWRDQSTNGRDAVYENYLNDQTNIPRWVDVDTYLNDQPAVNIKAYSDTGNLNSSTGFIVNAGNAGNNFTVISAHYYQEPASGFQSHLVWYGTSANDGNGNNVFKAGLNDYFGTYTHIVRNGGGEGGINSSAPGAPAATWLTPYIYVFTKGSGADPLNKVHLNVNGFEFPDAYANATDIYYVASLGPRFCIGASPKEYGGDPLKGKIAEVLVYDRVLSTEEKNLIANYLKAKYAISF